MASTRRRAAGKLRSNAAASGTLFSTLLLLGAARALASSSGKLSKPAASLQLAGAAGRLAADSTLANDERVGVVVYAPPKLSGQLKCEALVESIRSQGKWGGRLYLITEQLKCYQHERWTQCGLDAEIIALDDGPREEADDESTASTTAQQQQQPANSSASASTQAHSRHHHHHHSGFSRWWHGVFGPSAPEVERARLVRSQLWQLLQPPASVQALVYVHGCDQLMGAPLLPFVEDALASFNDEKDGPRPMLVVAPPGPPLAAQPASASSSQQQEDVARRRWTTGAADDEQDVSRAAVGRGAVWVLHRQHSAGLLEAWRETVREQRQEKAAHQRERVRLSRAVLKREAQHLLHGGAEEEDEEKALLEHAVSRAWFKQRREQQGQQQEGGGADACAQPEPACAARHVRLATGWSRALGCDDQEGCGATGAPAVFNYVPPSVCGHYDHEMVADWVTTLDLCVVQDLGWCLPTHMQPFAKGWLPYPQCAKLELGLSRVSCQWSCTEPTVIRSPGFRTSVIARSLNWP